VNDSLLVVLDDMVAGTLTRLTGGRLRFEYHDDYRSREVATPLSVSMPRQVRAHSDATVRPWVWGLLPDNPKVLDQWARQFHASASSPFSMLATPVGHDCPGAVRFSDPDSVDELLTRPGRVTWLTEADVAERLRDLKRDSTAWLGRTFTGQFSLAGAQAKTALLFQNGRWGVPSGSTPTSHILKPAVAGLDDHDLNEHLCMDAARRAELLVARTRIAHFGDESAIVVERYDRIARNGRIRRIHQEDLCQALGVPPTAKYQNEGGPGPRAIVSLFRQAMTPSAAEEALSRFVDALAWNWLVVGTDAHAKNYSILLAGDQIRLAPLYDIASALPYDVHERKLRFAMKIGGDYRLWPHRNLWPKAAEELGLAPEAVVERVRALADRAPDDFADAAKAPDIVALKRKLPQRLVDLIAKRVAVCQRILG
jgi:serine/threonine-protein kinase HipA